MTRWTWDERKNAINIRKHGMSFPFAKLVFGDPLATCELDIDYGEVRWRTQGRIGDLNVIVIHTLPEAIDDEEGYGRIISARRATPAERRKWRKGES